MKPSTLLQLLLAVGVLGFFNFSSLQASSAPAHAVCHCCPVCATDTPCGECAQTKPLPLHQQIIAVRPAEMTPRVDVAMFSVVPVAIDYFQISSKPVAREQVMPWPGRSCERQAWLRLWLI